MWPEMVATFPGAIVVPATIIPPLGATWTGWPAMEKGVGLVEGTLTVLPPTTANDGPAETTWPAIVAMLPDGIVVPPTMTPPLGAIWTGWPAMEGGVGLAEGTLTVLPSMTACDDPAETTWPAIVATFPGASVVPATMMPPLGAIWTGWPAMSGGLFGVGNGTA